MAQRYSQAVPCHSIVRPDFEQRDDFERAFASKAASRIAAHSYGLVLAGFYLVVTENENMHLLCLNE
jgi:hypothetical protein